MTKQKEKYIKRLISLFLATTISFQTACGITDKSEKHIEISTEKEFEEETSEDIKRKLKIQVDVELIRKEIEENVNIIKEPLNFFDSYSPKYYYEEYLLTDEEIDEILKLSYNNVECTFEFDGNIEKIMETVKNNSIEYKKNHPEYTSAFIDYTSDLELFDDQFAFEIIFENVLKEIVEKNTNNINEDFHRMQDLKIFYGNIDTIEERDERYHKIYNEDGNFLLGYYDKLENIIVLMNESIKEMNEAYSQITESENMYYEELYFVLSHEINHLRQMICPCRYNNESHNIFNNHFVKTLIESSAESEIYNLNKTYYFDRNRNYEYTYVSERKQESLLMLIPLAKGNKKLEDYYNAISDTDVERFIEFFGLDNKEDIYKFYRVIDIIDGLNSRSELPFKIYEENINDKTLYDFKIDIGFGYRNEIFAMSLYNLAEYTNSHNDFELEDNLMIFNIIKSNIASDAYYMNITDLDLENSDYERVYDQSFVEQYIELEAKYINYLSMRYAVSEHEIREYEKELFWYEQSLMNLINDNISEYDIYKEKSKKLLEEFPILKAILFTNFHLPSQPKDLIENSKMLSFKYN